MINEAYGHKLLAPSMDGIVRCQCWAWHWPNSPDLPEAYAEHVKHEEEKEAALLVYCATYKSPSRFAKVGQVAITLTVFMVIMFTVMHFIG